MTRELPTEHAAAFKRGGSSGPSVTSPRECAGHISKQIVEV